MSIDENWQSSKITYLRLKSTKQSDIHKSKIENVKGQFSTDNEKRERNGQGVSLAQFLRTELTRGYQLEHDEERFSARREKIYSFMKIPREVEKFMAYGFLQMNTTGTIMLTVKEEFFKVIVHKHL